MPDAAGARRRPDIAQAERQLAAATARIGVATADLFPRFTILGNLGQQSNRFADLAFTSGTSQQNWIAEIGL